jgi:hypothetical protein
MHCLHSICVRTRLLFGENFMPHYFDDFAHSNTRYMTQYTCSYESHVLSWFSASLNISHAFDRVSKIDMCHSMHERRCGCRVGRGEQIIFLIRGRPIYQKTARAGLRLMVGLGSIYAGLGLQLELHDLQQMKSLNYCLQSARNNSYNSRVLFPRAAEITLRGLPRAESLNLSSVISLACAYCP